MFNTIKQSIQELVNPTPEKPTPTKNITNEKQRLESEVHKLFAKSFKDGFVLESVFTYKSLDETPIYWKARLKHADGRKIIRPIKKEDNCYKLGEPNFRGKKSLYLQERLKLNDEPVFVVEGENKAARLTRLGITAVTSGSATSASSADWSPLKGRKVIIWPDNDEPGKDFANNTRDILLGFGCEVSLVDIDKLNLMESGDVIDWLKQNPNSTKADIMGLPIVECKINQAMPTDETQTKVVSSNWAEPISLLEEPKRRPYPVDALPQSILEPIKEVVDFIQCPFPIAACSAIANISLVSQCLADVWRTNGLSGPSSLFFLIIAESGERKTSVDNKFSVPVREWEKEMRKDFDRKSKKYSADCYVWGAEEEVIQSSVKASAKKGEDISQAEEELVLHGLKEPTKPLLKSLIYTDSTMEALAKDLHFNLRYGGVFSAEAGSVFGGAGMQNDAATKYLAFLDSLWDGSPHTINRKNSESFTVEDARLSIALSVQPKTLSSFLVTAGKNARDIGFLARCLITKPESTQGTRMFKEAPGNWPALNRYYTRIRELLALIDPDKSQVMIQLSESAKNLWIDFYNRIEKELGGGGEFIGVRDVASKAADNCARLSALFHIYEYGTEGEVGPTHVEQAARIIEWHLYESREYLAAAKCNAKAQELSLLKEWLVKECKKHGANALKYSTVLQSGPSQLRSKDALKRALDGLSKANIIRVSDCDGTQFIDLNPALIVPDAVNDAQY